MGITMKKKLHSIFAMLIVSLIVLIVPSQRVFGETLPEGMVIGDEQGIDATRDGEYFVYIDDVMPGKKWKKTISMINMEKDIPYKLVMLISPSIVTGSLDLSEAIQMTLSYEGKIVYEGPASGISNQINLQNEPLDLGVFQAGDSRALVVEYSLSDKYTNNDFSQKNIFDNIWTFYAVKTKNQMPNKEDTPTGYLSRLMPKTGEDIKQAMLFICAGLLLVLTVLFIWKYRREYSK